MDVSMQEFLIAVAMSRVLNVNDSSILVLLNDRNKFKQEDQWWDGELSLAELKTMTRKLAMTRAEENNQDFETALRETENNVRVQLAEILSRHTDPIFEVLSKFEIPDEKQEDPEINVCGICQEDMKAGEDVRGMDCKHCFHGLCIYRWLKRKMECPLCRHCPMEEEDSDYDTDY